MNGVMQTNIPCLIANVTTAETDNNHHYYNDYDNVKITVLLDLLLTHYFFNRILNSI